MGDSHVIGLGAVDCVSKNPAWGEVSIREQKRLARSSNTLN